MVDATALGQVRSSLRQPGVYFAPIRHHSPACAWAVRELIREVRPTRVLIEAPVDLATHIGLLLDEDTKPPVAIAAIVTREKERRLAAYYPFCEHSPEYIALVEGRAIGAVLEFIDLPAADKAMLRDERTGEQAAVDDEHYFDSGDFVTALARELGCRDGFELWDHLFESRLGGADWQDLLADIGAYCAALRAATSAAAIADNGDAAREAHMAAAVQSALDEGGPCVVVAGGFHIPALIDAIAAGAEAVADSQPAGEEPASDGGTQTAASYLIRYGFGALDALNGYGAGLPQPGYYDHLWRKANAAGGVLPWRETALELVSRFSARSRDDGYAVTVPAQVEILRAAEGLAAMRGRAGAGRHDLIDAVRTALVKGEASAREAWTERLLEFLRGDAIGDVPASAGSPPLVEDARARARARRIDVSDGARRRRRLDIRRKPAHLKASRYFHAMALLDTGFADKQAGPDYLSNIGTARLFEEWSYAWSPTVEGRLIELAVHGDNVPDTCARLLEEKRIELQDAGQGRDIAAMAGLFVQGVLAGLGSRLAPFLRSLAADIQAHGEFELVAPTLQRLHYIAQASGPLGIPAELRLDGVLQTAYRRLVDLCADLPGLPEERIQPTLEALRLIVQLLSDSEAGVFDHTLFDEAIDRVADRQPPPEILGAVLAICVQAGRRETAELCRTIAGSFAGTVDREQDRIGVLRGLLFTAPELLWREPHVLEVVDEMLCGLSEADFMQLLPHIRLAFTALNPREADRVAGMLATIHGGRLTDFAGRSHDLTDGDLQRGVAAERGVRESIEADGLGHWLEMPE